MTVGANISVEHVDVHIRVSLFQLSSLLNRKGAANLTAIGTLGLAGTYTLNEDYAACILKFPRFKGMFQFVPAENPGVFPPEVFIGSYGLPAGGENGHAVAKGREFGTIRTTDSNLGLEITNKTLHLLQVAVQVDPDERVIIYLGNEISQEDSHIFSAPRFSKLAGMSS